MGGLAIIFLFSIGIGIVKWLYDVAFKFLHQGRTWDEWSSDMIHESKEIGKVKFNKLAKERFGVDEVVAERLVVWLNAGYWRNDITNYESFSRLFSMDIEGRCMVKKENNIVSADDVKSFIKDFDSDIWSYVKYYI